MKTWLIKSMLAVSLAIPASWLIGQEADQQPADADEAKIELEIKLKELAEKQRALGVARFRLASPKKEKAAWLGVSTSQVPDALRQHLKLKNKYIGLLVERVEPNSPADAANLEQFDIIEKVDDQWIVNTQQFSVVLRMRKPGDEVTLLVIREGQAQQIKAKLAEKELPALAMGGAAGFINMVPLPPGAAPFEFGAEGHVLFQGGDGLDNLLDLTNLHHKRNSTFVVKDDQHTIKVITKDGQRTLVASDENGVVIFEGPIDTEEEFAAVPDEIREKVKKLELPGGFKLRPGPATEPSDEDK